jgi:hypothetical protein
MFRMLLLKHTQRRKKKNKEYPESGNTKPLKNRAVFSIQLITGRGRFLIPLMS